MRLALVAAIAGGIVVAALVAMYVSRLPSSDYSLKVDALKDEQSLFVNARVVLENNGRLPLTDVAVDFGNGTREVIGTMDPGDRRDVSPPETAQLETVTVTAKPGITITQEYRKPIKLPGMIGS
jgi:hypothetical protein